MCPTNNISVNPYEPPEAELTAQKTFQRKPVALVSLLSILCSGASLLSWGYGSVGPIVTSGCCLFGGWAIARRLHQSPGFIALGTLLYGFLIALTIVGIAFGACLVLMNNYH